MPLHVSHAKAFTNDIGESLLPSVRHHLRFIGVEEKIASFGFHKKPGATIKLSQLKRGAWFLDTDFLALGRDNYAWNVTRSEFDRILLDHAESTGVHVFRSTNVTSLYFSGKRPTSAQWNHGTSSWSGTIAFDYLIDASGRAGLIASHYLQNRRSNASLRNVAMWAKWRNTDASARGTAMEGATYIEALSDQSGWAWFIPLHDGVASVGIVRTQIAFNQALRSRDYRLKLSESFEATPLKDAITTSSSVASCSDHDSSTSGQSTVVWDSTVLLSSLSSSPSPFSRGDACITPTATGKLYIDALDLAPTVNRLLGCKGEPESTTVYTARDYSYCASYYAGEHFRLVGDAAGALLYSNI
ncbi:hypothetical protein F5148DRAFT_1274153 [Russula earlei]|uniref:Uncharacterized protein n=1 Tax=Russula earlei TaxID=71964 RepID=A0ACC0UJZ2_9AGAM|nr:hypothetical protein F5148DRAFT_1274153 [Russula earlei]